MATIAGWIEAAMQVNTLKPVVYQLSDHEMRNA